MSAPAPLQNAAAKPQRPVTGGLVLQRKCACGSGTSSLTGECEQCRKKKQVGLQTMFRISEPGNVYEQEADRVAEQVMRMPDLNGGYRSHAGSMRALFQRRVSGNGGGFMEAPPLVDEVLHSPGQPLDAATREFFEPRFGHDFSRVRVHTDAKAADSARAVNAVAYSTGRHIAFGQRQFRPHTAEGKELLAHELSHVVQQGNAKQVAIGTQLSVGRSELMVAPIIQRRLLATGAPADIQNMLSLLEPAVGKDLEHDPMTRRVEIVDVLADPAESPAAQRLITDIIDNGAQDAEIHVGVEQTYSTEVPLRYETVGVDIGQFPFPGDLTGKKIQTVDIDDFRVLENGSPGHGVAALVHEIAENYHAHSLKPQGGVDRFDVSHRAGIEAQSNVAEELVGPGRRVANVVVPIVAGGTRIISDFENYYVVIDKTKNAITGSSDVVSARKVSRINVKTYIIDNFDSGMRAVPAAGGLVIAAVLNDLMAFGTATVRIEGFSDDTGTGDPNVKLATRRGELTRDDIIAAGAIGGVTRFHVVGYGAINFVAPNNSEANRALNRRVIITIDRPDI